MSGVTNTLIHLNGFFNEADSLLNGTFFEMPEIAANLLNISSVLVIPCGGLFGKENVASFKVLLEEYTRMGGTIIIFSQQYGTHIDSIVPIPEGKLLKSYGWREDQSCLKNSVYYDSVQAVLSSSTNQQVDAGVDGYFQSYPSDSTILLRRQTNREPALLYYHYGNGTVILTSMFTDWAYSHGQASTTELNLVRDLITFAKNPKLPIPMYNLTNNPTPTVNLTIKVKNNTESSASNVKLVVYTPDRKILMYETEASIGLNQDETTEIPVTFTFTLPQLEITHFGIYHTFYELYDAEGNLVQMQTESDSGRFAIYKTPQPYTSTRDIDMWLTAETEYVYWDEKPKVTIHIKNNTDEAITDCTLAYDWWHHYKTGIPGSFSLAPDEIKTITFEPKLKLIYNHRTAMEGLWVHLRYYSHKYNDLIVGKGVRVLFPRTQSNITFPGGKQTYRFGFPVDYQFNILNETGKAASNVYGENPRPIDVNVKLSVVKGYWYYDEEEIETLYETSIHIDKNSTFNYPGSYTPTGITEPGEYRFKLEIEKPNGSKEIRYKGFYYYRSSVKIDTYINDQLWLPGHIYTYSFPPGEQIQFKIKLKNNYDMDITNGKYTLTAVNKETGQLAFSKELTGISLPGKAEKEFAESVVFAPPAPAGTGDYIFSVVYSDETRTPDLPTRFERNIRYKIHTRLTYDKPVYHFMDTANVGLNIEAVGKLHVEFKCLRAGIDEAFDIELPANSPFYIKDYSIPLLSPQPGIYEVYYKVTDEAGNVKEGGGRINKKDLLLNSLALAGELGAREGKPYKYTLIISESSGVTSPTNGTLSVSCLSLGFNESRSVTILPGVSNRFDFDIPIPVQVHVQGDNHPLEAQFLINGVNYLRKAYAFSIRIAGFHLELPEPPINVNAGETLHLNYRNSGGRKGEVDVIVKISEKGVPVVDHKETLVIGVEEQRAIDILIPGNLKSGIYSIYQAASHEFEGKTSTFNKIGQINVTGLSAALDSFTLKEKYFEDEVITGKSDITAGSGIENGKLKAGIVRYADSKGIEDVQPGDFIPANLIEKGFSTGTTLYLSTDKGILAYDKASGNVTTLYDFNDTDNIAFNSTDMLVSSTGDLWIAAFGNGIFRQDPSGQWIHYTTADGLASDWWIKDIIEIVGTGGPEIWATSYSGISVFRNNAWSVYTVADGLISNSVYKLAADGNGNVWISTSSGVCRFNGTGFEAVSTPFGSTTVSNKLTGTSDGSVWMATPDKLYRYLPLGPGEWQEWSLAEILPQYTLSIRQMETINGQLWINGQTRDVNNILSNVLVYFSGDFIGYFESEIPGFKGLDYRSIIPGSGESVQFICELGFMDYSYNSGTWNSHLLDIDGDKLSGQVFCLAKDSTGKIWTGTEYGFSMFDGNRWHNYFNTPGNRLLLGITMIDTDGQGNVYGYSFTLRKIIKLNSTNGAVELISFPSGFSPFHNDNMAVDNSGRLWLGRSNLYYYDGQWHNLPGLRPPGVWSFSLNSMVKDHNGGLWLGAWEWYYQNVSHLFHIKNDLTIEDYTASNSDLQFRVKDRLYLDKEGILWIRYEPDYWSEIRHLQSFDGFAWVDYGSYEGFPQYGVRNFVKDDNGRLLVLGYDGGYGYNLYALENDKFVLQRDERTYINNSMLYSNGTLYCAGRETSTFPYADNILKIRFHEGLLEEELWSQTYPLNLQAGENISLDVLTGKNLPSGSYVLKTQLLSSLGQELAESRDSFIVRGSGISVVLSGENDESPASPYIRAGESLTANVEILNNTSDGVSGLEYVSKKRSPSGVVEVLKSETHSIAAGGSYTDTFTFSESEKGTWRLTAEIGSESSEMLLAVAEPMASMEILSPQYAGQS